MAFKSLLGWLVFLSASVPLTAAAQVIPDETLGSENSRVRRATVRGREADLIEGGATRGRNLFHSFREFGIREGDAAYFANPATIENIFSRVTGDTPSNILGTLGVDGTANLFLINPNGIVFGPNASLDIQGSFAATTANAIGFGEAGFFSATNPEAPSQLLTVNPSAFLFNQVPTGNLASIINSSRSNNVGLLTRPGQNLLLLGGLVENRGGILTSAGGRIEIGSVAGTGIVGFNSDGSLDFPENLIRGDIAFTNQSLIQNFFLDSGGDVVVTGGNIDIAGQSSLGIGLLSISPPESQSGDLILNATDTIQIREGSRILNIVDEGTTGNAGAIRINTGSLLLAGDARLSTTTFGRGNAGSILINAQDLVSLNNGGTIFGGPIEATGAGAGGNVQIRTGTLSITDGSRLVTYVEGSGNAGNISIEARDQVLISGNAMVRNYVQGGGTGNSGDIDINAGTLLLENAVINNGVLEDGRGDGGSIHITAQSVSLIDESSIRSFTLGQGSAGGILITASDRVSASRSAEINSFTDDGTGGDIHLEARAVSLTDGGFLETISFGQGDAGDIVINAQEQVSLNSRAIVFSRTNATGEGGSIQIQAGSFQIVGDGVSANAENDAVAFNTGLFAETFGQGNSGDISIRTSNQVKLDNGGAISTFANQNSIGNAGGISIDTGSMTVRGLASLSTTSAGQGNAGNLIVNARDNILISGGRLDSPLRSSIRSNVVQGAAGDSGNLEITTGSLQVEDLAALSTSTSGDGDAGDVIINARDNVVFNNGIIFTTIESTATGDGGDIRVTANSLSLLNGGQLDASTFGRGNSGNVIVKARDRVILDGISPFRGVDGRPRGSTLFTEVVPGAQGNGGDVIITTGTLVARNGGRLEASTEGRGNAGSVIVNARNLVAFDGTSPGEEISSGALSNVVEGAVGNGGDVRISAANLRIANGAQLDASTEGRGNAGDITIRVQGSVTFDGVSENGQLGSAAFTRVDQGAIGNAGNLEITANSLSITNGAALQAETLGRGNAGTVTINVRDRVSIDGFNDLEIGELDSGGKLFRRFLSGIFSDVGQSATGEGGDIQINAPLLSITNQAIVDASTSGQGRAGDVTVTADTLEVITGGRLATTTRSGRPAGTIRVRALENIRLDGAESGILASTEAGSTGNGGSIDLSTTTLDLNDQARISAQSQGSGAAGGVTIRASEDVTLNDRARISTQSQGENAPAGDIQITAGNTFTATDSDVTTSAANASGGDIRLTTRDVRLFGDSDIRTNSARDGGNISVNADTVVALDDSDIFASAAQGRGGDITLNTPAFFGDNYQPEDSENAEVSELDNNNRVDLNATGTVSSGTISTPDTSFIQNSLSDLTENVVDTDSLIANSCIARNETGGTFLITGTGGLPSRPGSASLSTYPTGAVRTEAGEAESSSWQPGDAIVEPQGVYQLPDGRLVLSRECS